MVSKGNQIQQELRLEPEDSFLPLRRLAIQNLPESGASWSVVPLSRVICVFRGTAVKRDFVSGVNGIRLRQDRIYVRTTCCHNLKSGVYLTSFRSLKVLKQCLPSQQFFYINPNTLLNQEFFRGANVFEVRNKTRMINIHDDPSLLPVRLLVTSGYLRGVKSRLGLPVRRRRQKRD